MKRALLILTCTVAVTAALLSLPQQAVSADRPGSQQVVIVIAPYLSWEDVTATSTPVLQSLAQRGAVGAVNARSRSRLREIADAGSPLEGALSISSGSWAAFDRNAAAAYSVNERYEVGTAAEAFRRTTGDQVGLNSIVFLGMPVTQRLNESQSYVAVPGILGEAVEKAGGRTAAIGNSDVGYVTGEQRRVRPAALIAMNAKGLVGYGDVSQRLLSHDPYAAFGIETDIDRFEREVIKVRKVFSEGTGPTLVVLDSGDMYRVTKFRTQVTDRIYVVHKKRALKSLDAVIGLAEKHFPKATIMVVGQATGDPELNEVEGLGPIVVAGEGFEGYLSSASTQRDGLATNLDVTATVLERLGIERPVEVLGSALFSQASDDSVEARFARLARMNATAVAVDEAKVSVVNVFVSLTVVVLLVASFVIVRAAKWKSGVRSAAATSLKAFLLGVMAVPLSAWTMFLWNRWPSDSPHAVIALLASLFITWVVLLVTQWKSPSRVPAALACLATTVVICVDQVLGSTMSFTNFFGYSPLLAARFYGIGNEAAAILFGSAITGVALLADQWPEAPVTVAAKRFGLPLLSVAIIAVAAAPFWGANVGVAIWGVIGFGIAFLLMNGHHVSWRSVALLLVAVAVVIGLFAVIDLSSGTQTHLGRAIGSAEQGGVSELVTIVARKAETNARVLTRTRWAYILVATLAFLGFMRWRPQGDFAATLTENPHFADAITVVLVAGVVAYFTEDSGIVIPALAVFYTGTALSWLMLSRVERAATHTGPNQGMSSR